MVERKRQTKASFWGSSVGKLHPAMLALEPDDDASQFRDAVTVSVPSRCQEGN
jgi:hypothetical protein